MRKRRKLAQRKAKKMRVRDIQFWTGQIEAEKSFPAKMKTPQNKEEEVNYMIAEYFVINTKSDTTKLKLVA